MERQCAWCLKILNIFTGKWEQGPALRSSITVCCPACKKKLDEYNSKEAA